jgi:hypothetical protein
LLEHALADLTGCHADLEVEVGPRRVGDGGVPEEVRQRIDVDATNKVANVVEQLLASLGELFVLLGLRVAVISDRLQLRLQPLQAFEIGHRDQTLVLLQERSQPSKCAERDRRCGGCFLVVAPYQLDRDCSCSPDPRHLVVLARPGFVRAAPIYPGTSRDKLPSAPPPCCDKVSGEGLSPPLATPAPHGAHPQVLIIAHTVKRGAKNIRGGSART